MANFSKTVKKVHSIPDLKDKFVQNPFQSDKGFHNPLNVLESSADDLGEAFTPEIPEPEEETIIPLPTASTAKNEARKKRARAKGTGRSSTILTEGLGG